MQAFQKRLKALLFLLSDLWGKKIYCTTHIERRARFIYGRMRNFDPHVIFLRFDSWEIKYCHGLSCKSPRPGLRPCSYFSVVSVVKKIIAKTTTEEKEGLILAITVSRTSILIIGLLRFLRVEKKPRLFWPSKQRLSKPKLSHECRQKSCNGLIYCCSRPIKHCHGLSCKSPRPGLRPCSYFSVVSVVNKFLCKNSTTEKKREAGFGPSRSYEGLQAPFLFLKIFESGEKKAKTFVMFRLIFRWLRNGCAFENQ